MTRADPSSTVASESETIVGKTESKSIESLERSVARRIASLNAALGDPWAEDRRLAYYASAIRDTEAARKGRKAPRPTAAFLTRADYFLHANAIALSIVGGDARRGEWDRLTHRASAKFAVESIRLGHVRSVAGLKDLEVALLTEWYESAGRGTDAFWRQIEKARIPYVKRNVIEEIFKLGRIRSREQYDFAVDTIGVLEEDGVIDNSQARDLARMIGEFESR